MVAVLACFEIFAVFLCFVKSELFVLISLVPPGLFIRSHSHFSVVRPVRVDGAGRFVSPAVPHHPPAGSRVFYRLQNGKRELLLNLTLNPHLLSRDHVVETRGGNRAAGGTGRQVKNHCHLLGTVTDGDAEGTAAISTCSGLVRTACELISI